MSASHSSLFWAPGMPNTQRHALAQQRGRCGLGAGHLALDARTSREPAQLHAAGLGVGCRASRRPRAAPTAPPAASSSRRFNLGDTFGLLPGRAGVRRSIHSPADWVRGPSGAVSKPTRTLDVCVSARERQLLRAWSDPRRARCGSHSGIFLTTGPGPMAQAVAMWAETGEHCRVVARRVCDGGGGCIPGGSGRDSRRNRERRPRRASRSCRGRAARANPGGRCCRGHGSSPAGTGRPGFLGRRLRQVGMPGVERQGELGMARARASRSARSAIRLPG